MKPTPEIIECAARAAHEANRAFCDTIGDTSQVPWEDAEEWQRDASREGVKVVLEGATPEETHEAWMAKKLADGWKLGPVKDSKKKTHPAMVPYSELPREQQVKDHIFHAVVHAIADAFTD